MTKESRTVCATCGAARWDGAEADPAVLWMCTPCLWRWVRERMERRMQRSKEAAR